MLERARDDFEAAALLVGAELAAVQEEVQAATVALSAERAAAAEARKRRRLSSGQPADVAVAALANPDEQAEGIFAGCATDTAEQLLSARRRVGADVQLTRAGVDAVKVSARPLLAPGRLMMVVGRMAVAKEARNEACSGLVRLPGPVQLLVLSQLSVVQLWHVRGVSRHLYRGGTEALQGLPRLASVGGALVDHISITSPMAVAGPEVEVLSLATMRWSAAGVGVPPPLPAPRAHHALAAFGGERVVVAGGYNENGADPMYQLQKQAVQWVPGSAAWVALPDMAEKRSGAVAVALPDGRLLVAGGGAGQTYHASAEVLAADGSGWAAAAAMSGPRTFAAAGLLPSGRVIVAGGKSGAGDAAILATVEQWDPVEDRWSVLPPMLNARLGPTGVVLVDGRFAVVGGFGADDHGADNWHTHTGGEVFDPATGRWEALPGTWQSRVPTMLLLRLPAA